MAESFSRDRLQPALFDRLIDESPGHATEATEQRMISRQRLRESVLRDLTWLLNAQADLDCEPGLALERSNPARRSVVNFGMPPLSGRLVSRLEIADVERMVRDAIATFEPRILPETLAVRARLPDDPMGHHNCLSFEIVGQLWAQPYPLELLLKTEIDLETGRVEVREDRRVGLAEAVGRVGATAAGAAGARGSAAGGLAGATGPIGADFGAG